jgi:hypothetical protein
VSKRVTKFTKLKKKYSEPTNNVMHTLRTKASQQKYFERKTTRSNTELMKPPEYKSSQKSIQFKDISKLDRHLKGNVKQKMVTY